MDNEVRQADTARGVLCNRENVLREHFPSFHDCETGNGIEIDNDGNVVTISEFCQELCGLGSSRN